MAAIHMLGVAFAGKISRMAESPWMPNFHDSLERPTTDSYTETVEEANSGILSFFNPIINFFKTYSLETFLVIFSVLFLFLLIFLYRKIKYRCIEKLVYEREFSSDSVYAEGTVYLTETIYNPTLFPLFFVDVQEYIFGGLWLDGNRPEGAATDVQEVISRFHLMPFMRVKRRHEVYCQKRGDFFIESVRIHRKNNPYFMSAPAHLYVYPKLTDPVINSVPISCLLGEYTSQRRMITDPFSFAGIREYRFGDSTSSINYKATAKRPVHSMNDIMVNSREYCTGRMFMVYLNFHIQQESQVIADNYEALMDYGLSVASAVLRRAIADGCKCGFACNCKTEEGEMQIRFPMESSEEHQKQVLRGMAQIRPSDGTSIKRLLQMDIDEGLNNAEVIFITTYMDDEIDDRLRVMKQNTNAVAVIQIGEDDLDEEL